MVAGMVQRRIAKARANRTTSTYRSGRRSYERACHRLKIEPWPASEVNLVTYVAYAHETMGITPSTIRTYVSAICYEHRISGWVNPKGDSGILGLVLDGCKRIDAEKGIFPSLRLPIDAEALHKLIRSLDLSEFKAARFAAFASLAFYGAFRPGELVFTESSCRFLWEDVSTIRHDTGFEYLRIHQYLSKTRQFGPVIQISVGANGGPTCPLRLIKNYANLLQRCRGDTPVFASIDGAVPYRYDDALQDMRRYLIAAGWKDTKNLSLHSFRIGLATEAGRKNLPNHVIQMLGRWTSDCFLRYIRADPFHLARVTADLGPKTTLNGGP